MAVEAKIGFNLPPHGIDLAPSPETKVPQLKILFNGQQDGAAKLLQRFIDKGHNIVGVVADTNPEDAVRKLATEKGFEIIDLDDVNKKEARKRMDEMEPDLGVSFYLQKILGSKTFSIPKYGTLNVHYSLKNHGRDGMQRDVMNGEDVLGAMVFLMTKKVDAGPIAGTFGFKNPGNQSQGSLYHEHQDETIELVEKAVDNMAIAIDQRQKDGKQKLPLWPQEPGEFTYYPPLEDKDMEVNFQNMTAEEINRVILAGGPGAWFKLKKDGRRIFLAKPIVGIGNLRPRQIASTEQGVVVGAKEGVIVLGQMGDSKKDRVPANVYLEQNQIKVL